MREHVRALAWDSLIYGLGSASVRGLALLLLPVVTRLLDPTAYGTLDLVTAAVILFGPFVGLGISTALRRFYYEAPEGNKRRLLVSTGLWAIVAVSIPATLLLVVGSRAISNLVFGTPQHWLVLAISFVSMPFGAVLGYSQQVLQLRRQPFAYSMVNLLQSLVSVGVALPLMLAWRLGITGYVVGFLLAGPIMGCCLGVWLVRGEIAFRFSGGDVRRLLAFGLPLVPIDLAGFVSAYAGRFLVARWESLALLGLFAVASKVVAAPQLLGGAFGLAWSPYIMRQFAQSRSYGRTIAETTNYAIIFFFAVALAFTLLAREILALIAPPEYAGAIVVVPALAIAVVATVFYTTTSLGMSFAKKPIYYTLITFVAALLNVAMNLFLIPAFGIVGASVASALTATFAAVVGFVVSQRVWMISFDLRRILTISACAVVMIALAPLLRMEPLWLGITMKVLYLALFPALLIVLRGITDRELRWVWQQLSKKVMRPDVQRVSP